MVSGLLYGKGLLFNNVDIPILLKLSYDLVFNMNGGKGFGPWQGTTQALDLVQLMKAVTVHSATRLHRDPMG